MLIKKIILSKQLSSLFRLFLGFLFIYASIDKILHPAQFAKIVYNFHILPGFLINLFAIVLPWIEFLTGAFLILGIAAQLLNFLVRVLKTLTLYPQNNPIPQEFKKNLFTRFTQFLEKYTESVAFLVSGLLVMFLIALGINLIRGVDINCGCFSTAGSAKSNLSKRVLEDILFLVMSLQVWKCNRGFANFKNFLSKR